MPQRFIRRTLCAVFTLALIPSACAQSPTVHTESGPVQGIAGSDPQITAFLGIPYAAPPVGDLRWRDPQPPAKWTAVRKADQFGAGCMQHIAGARLPWTKEFMAQLPISEDCLYLNVWTPSTTPKKPMAVLFWIHGGGFTEGSASPTIFNGEQLAKQGIVVVSINYRLGIEGYFALPELTAESPHHASGNYGLMDMIAALQWTKKNIRNFGGDPGKVTIDGQSAGASAVEFLTASPLATGLFRGGVIESGAYITGPSANTAAQQEQMGTAFATFAKKPMLKDLRALSETDLRTIESKAHLKFVPDVDGWVLPDTVSAIFAAGKQNDVPTINGMVADEGSSHAGYGLMTPDEFQKQVRASRGSHADDFLKLYPCSTQPECSESQKAYERDRRLVSMYLWGVARAKTAKTPAYTYIFTHPIPWPDHPEFAVFHSTEIPYWMHNLKILDRPFTPVDFQLSDTVSSYWVNFVKTGSPDAKGLPLWPAFDPAKDETMGLGDQPQIRAVTDPERFALWMKYLQAVHSKG